MRLALKLTVLSLLASTAALGQSAGKIESAACTPELKRIGEALRKIEATLSTVSQQGQLQSQVGALAALDTDIANLSTELQRSIEGRAPLVAAVVRYSGRLAAGQQLPPLDLADQAAQQEALDQLDKRIEEIRRTLSVRKSQLAAVEKTLEALTRMSK